MATDYLQLTAISRPVIVRYSLRTRWPLIARAEEAMMGAFNRNGLLGALSFCRLGVQSGRWSA